MLARSHALSGAAGWLAACAAAGPVAGIHPPLPAVTTGAVVAAAAALLPDIDHPGSTVARSLGPLTRTIARVVSRLSDAVRDSTCGCCATTGTSGHRTLTHTLAFAAVVGVVVSAAGVWWGHLAAAVVVTASIGLVGLALLPRRRARAGVVVLMVYAGAQVYTGGAGVDWWWLGAPAGWGVLTHSLGDAATHHGVPLWWPVSRRGCRWRRVGLPTWLRFRTGGGVETLVSVLMVAAGVAAGWVLLT